MLIPGEGSSARRLAPADWSARFEALAPHCPGVTLAGPLGREFILAAADRVVGDPGALTLEAIALGVPTVLLEDPESVSPVPKGVALRASTLAELCSAVRAPLEPGAPGLLGGPRSHWAQELLCREQGSAERVADQILTLLSDAPRGASRPGNREGASPNPNDPKAVSVPPPDDSDEALYLELEARVGFGECSGAIERLRAHLGRRPSAEGYRRLASFYRRAEQPDPACEAAAQAERLARDELARTLCERGRTEVDRGRTEDARTLFEEAQHLAPHLVDPWLGVGSLKLAGGAHAFAEEAFQRAVERDPKSVPAWTGLGLALLGEGRANESLDVFEQALDLEPRALPAIFGLVQAAFRVGALARAERRVRACLEVRSGNLDLAFTLAGLRTQLGDPSGAREMLDRIELFRPDYPGLAELRAKLEGN